MNLDYAHITRGKTQNRNDDFVTCHSLGPNIILAMLGDFTGDSHQGTNNLFRERMDGFVEQQQQNWINQASKPAEILQSIFAAANQWLKKNQARKAQTTLVLMIADGQQGALHYLVAGDSGLAILRDDQLEFLQRGEMSGAKDASQHLPGPMRPVESSKFLKGDRIIAFSDGLWDTTQGMIDAEDHLVAAVGGGNRGMVERNLHDHLVNVATFEDDLTVLVIFPEGKSAPNRNAADVEASDIADAAHKADALSNQMSGAGSNDPRTPVQQVLVDLFQNKEGQYNQAVAAAIKDMRPQLEIIVKDEIRQKQGHGKASAHQKLQTLKTPTAATPATANPFADKRVLGILILLVLTIVAILAWPYLSNLLAPKPYVPQVYAAANPAPTPNRQQQLAYVLDRELSSIAPELREIEEALSQKAIIRDDQPTPFQSKMGAVQIHIREDLEMDDNTKAFLLWLQLATGQKKAQLPVPQAFRKSFLDTVTPKLKQLEDAVAALKTAEPAKWQEALLATDQNLDANILDQQLRELLLAQTGMGWVEAAKKEMKRTQKLPAYRELRVLWLAQKLAIPAPQGEVSSLELFNATTAQTYYDQLVPKAAIAVPKPAAAKPSTEGGAQ